VGYASISSGWPQGGLEGADGVLDTSEDKILLARRGASRPVSVTGLFLALGGGERHSICNHDHTEHLPLHPELIRSIPIIHAFFRHRAFGLSDAPSLPGSGRPPAPPSHRQGPADAAGSSHAEKKNLRRAKVRVLARGQNSITHSRSRAAKSHGKSLEARARDLFIALVGVVGNRWCCSSKPDPATRRVGPRSASWPGLASVVDRVWARRVPSLPRG